MDEPKDIVPAEVSEDEFPDWENELLDDDSWDERDEQALANLDAGKFISHAAMMLWLRSLGTENELPPPECGM